MVSLLWATRFLYCKRYAVINRPRAVSSVGSGRAPIFTLFAIEFPPVSERMLLTHCVFSGSNAHIRGHEEVRYGWMYMECAVATCGLREVFSVYGQQQIFIIHTIRTICMFAAGE